MSATATTGPLTRDAAKREVALAFGRAIDSCGYTNEHVAELLSGANPGPRAVSLSRVRKLRSGDAADLDAIPSLADLLLADHLLAAALLRELGAVRLRHHGPSPVATPERVALSLLAAQAGVQHAIAEGMHDGRISSPELTLIAARVLESRDVEDQLVAMARGKR
jgi:hypothetical protein